MTASPITDAPFPRRAQGALVLGLGALLSCAASLAPAGEAIQAGDDAWPEDAEVYRFPPNMQVVDVREKFGAVGDGKADDTAALQKAFSQRNAFVYLRNGTYLVRERIMYTDGPSVLPGIQGESRDGVIIKLAPDAKGFDDPKNPVAMVQMVRGEAKDRLSADYFKTKMRNLTLDTGDHKGATGLIFYANNNGTLRNVRIVGKGEYGLDLSRQLNGPLFCSQIEIEGFRVGIRAGSGPFNSQTLEHIRLRGQREFGIQNDGEAITVRNLRSENTVPALICGAGQTTIIDGRLIGGGASQPAVVSLGRLYLRNIAIEGYGTAVAEREFEKGKEFIDGKLTGELKTSDVPGGVLAEWSATKPVGRPGDPAPAKPLSLPIENAPYVPLETDFSKWVLVDDYGAIAGDKNEDTEGVLKAIAAAQEKGATVLAFKAGNYILKGEIPIGGSIARVQGANTFLRALDESNPVRFSLAKDGAPVVMFDMIDRALGPKLKIHFENPSSRTLVLRNLRCEVIASGDGKVFCEDAGSVVDITNPKARVWMRQLNSEGVAHPAHSNNKGGSLWILGLKTEGTACIISTTAGGSTEVLGAWIYVISRDVNPTVPIFTQTDSSATYAGIVQFHAKGFIYKDLISDTRGGDTQMLTTQNNPDRAFIQAYTSLGAK
jgi:hypothetical protein